MSIFILPEDGSGRIVTFDVIESETHETISEITAHPVEKGVEITDHVRPQPDRLSVIGVITNQPIFINPITERGELLDFPFEAPEYFPSAEALLTSPGGALRFGVGALSNAIGDLLGLNEQSAKLLSFGAPFNAIIETYETLIELQKNAVLLSIFTPVRFYVDMLIERVATPRTAGDASVAFQIDFRQIRVVESGSVTAPPIPVEPRGVPEKAMGGQGAAPPDAGESAEETRSILLRIAQAAGAPF